MSIEVAAETAVLAVLAPGGMLTASRITAQAPLTNWSARRAIGQLESHGLIMRAPYQSRWSITPRSRAAWATMGRWYGG
ncbi:hypothetical protein [Nocardia transvalensis]|uniref:hypothetical protein n=1 Tax=Nocardia transvalensis TaxID=37333 RepID=UPI001894D239|nr:hypothetical protein [Nocardia transvalensis]MBF6330072.1 hypothetical protein [Nocardia transvalensis]